MDVVNKLSSNLGVFGAGVLAENATAPTWADALCEYRLIAVS